MINYNLILIELILLTIVVMSGLIAWEFYKSRNGQLRKLLIALFACNVYLYGGAAIWFFFLPPSTDGLMRAIILNTPMMIIMVNLYKYIRKHNYQ